MAWLAYLPQTPGLPPLRHFAATHGDKDWQAQVDALQCALFAVAGKEIEWNAASYLRGLTRARRRWLGLSSTARPSMALAPLNPVG